VPVGVDPGVVLDRLRQVAPAELREVLEGRFHNPDQNVDRRDDRQLAEPVLDAEQPGDERALALHDHVDRSSDQQFRTDVGELVDGGADRRPDHLAPVAGGVLPEPEERVDPPGRAGVRF
jgi:hypothetical protein